MTIEMRKFSNFTLRFNLTAFIGSRVIYSENADGVMERGVFIPIDQNALYEDPRSRNVMCEAFVNAKATNTLDDKTHYLKQKTSLEHVKWLNDLGYQIPTLGSMWLNNFYGPSFQRTHKTGDRVKINND